MGGQPVARRGGKTPHLCKVRTIGHIHHGQRTALLGQVGMGGTGRYHYAAGGIHIGGFAVHFQFHAASQRIQQLYMAVAVRLLFAAVVAHRVIRGEQR